MRGAMIAAVLVLGTGLLAWWFSVPPHEAAALPPGNSVQHTEAEWRARLTPQQFYVLRQRGTESPRSGAYWDTHTAGEYRCVACDALLFQSDTKFDSGTGWPSFWAPANPTALISRPDGEGWTARTEVVCASCGGHLGHVFDDGPRPTGKRYCINSVCLRLVPRP